MRRRTLLTTAVSVPLAAAAASQLASSKRKDKDRPNIVLICIDDLNSWIGCLGLPTAALTPAIDSLAKRGTLFKYAYCAAPYCNASRYAVFTGCNPLTTGIFADEPYWSSPGRRITSIEQLKKAGYITFGAGKVFHGKYGYQKARSSSSAFADWEEVENRKFLWDGYLSSGQEPLPSGHPLNGIRETVPTVLATRKPWSPQFDWGILSDEEEITHPDVRTTDAVVEFLKKSHRKPYICAAGLYKPHLPWYATKRFFDHYPLNEIVLPRISADDLDDVPPIARRWVERQPDHPTIMASGHYRQAIQAYLACISFVDEQVGRILAAIDSSPARDHTIVALWSDNGFHLGEKLHWRKFTLWEQATRVPMIIAYPAGKSFLPTIDTPVGLVDLFPTLLDLCNVSPLPGVDGHSLVPLMTGKAGSQQKPVLMTWGRGNYSLRSRSMRYTRYLDGGEELYDLNTDPDENTNLINRSSYIQHHKTLELELNRLVG